MADILLIEAGYKNKYPPIGLMKISYFHKYICNDYVRFSKGPLPDELKDKKWDRVYVTTLFTFEWENTKKIIEYAYSVVKDNKQVYTGGILATLMPELIKATFPDIINNTGLLNHKGTLGLEREEEIDTLPLDYNILEDTDYVYPAHDAYFTYMTRGCGMRCQFCAVQTLEPSYIPYLSIRENIERINTEFGPKKDLLLMDNNVLISPCFDKIIDEIKDFGFAKGATYINPRTGKKVNRYVDFNQGLDAKLLTSKKAKRLGELAIYPARIAFDHIEDKEIYIKAVTLCAESGIDFMSNYLLYNGEKFTGKGSSYCADTPEDLYDRMRISLDLGDELTKRLGRKISIFSFPMRYIPLSDLKRGFVGTNWNVKYLRAVQRMMIPTQGKGVASRDFFITDFGHTAEEFVEFLAMPEDILGMRGHFVQKKGEQKKDRDNRYVIWHERHDLVNAWLKEFRFLEDEKETFISVIGNNVFTYDIYRKINSDKQRKMFLYYFTVSGLLKAINEELEDGNNSILHWLSTEYPLLKKRMIQHIACTKINASLLEKLVKLQGKVFLKEVLQYVDVLDSKTAFVFDNFEKACIKANIKIIDFSIIKYAQLFMEAGVFDNRKQNLVRNLILNLNEEGLRETLIKSLDLFKNTIMDINSGQAGEAYVVEKIEDDIMKLYKQLSLFEG